jgi:hypothetical protein
METWEDLKDIAASPVNPGGKHVTAAGETPDHQPIECLTETGKARTAVSASTG